MQKKVLDVKDRILHYLNELEKYHIYVLTTNMYIDYNPDMLEHRLCTIEPIGICTISKIMVIELIKMAEMFKIKTLLELEND